MIKDGEASKSFQELVAIYMVPAMQVISRSVDRAVLGQVHELLAAPSGRGRAPVRLDPGRQHRLSGAAVGRRGQAA